MTRVSLYGYNITSSIPLAGHEWLERPLGRLAVETAASVSIAGERIDGDVSPRVRVYETDRSLSFEVVGVGATVAWLNDGLVVCDASFAGSVDGPHLLATLVLPRVLVAFGHLALHGAGIVTPQGCVAVVADTGTGKSTLTECAGFRGLGVVTDDCLLVDGDGSVWPGERVIRPRRESSRPELALASIDGPMPLVAVVVVSGRGPEAMFDRLPLLEAIAAVHVHAFVAAERTVARSLRGVAEICASVPVFRGDIADGDPNRSLDAILGTVAMSAKA